MGTVVDGKATLVTVTPVISTSIYASGDQLGGINTLANAMDMDKDTGNIMSITVIDKAKQNAAFDILFFSDLPTVASSDNAPLDISDAEMASKCLGIVKVLSTDYVDLAANSVNSKYVVGLFLRSVAGSNTLYCVCRAAGTPTYVSTSDLVIKIGIVQD